MGADLITATLYHPSDVTLDWDAGRAAIATLEVGDVDNYLENFMQHPVSEGDVTEAQEEAAYVEAAKNLLSTVVDDVQHNVEGYSRSINMFTALGHRFIVTGDMSWGDTPELVDRFTILALTPKVMRAVGFTVEG